MWSREITPRIFFVVFWHEITFCDEFVFIFVFIPRISTGAIFLEIHKIEKIVKNRLEKLVKEEFFIERGI